MTSDGVTLKASKTVSPTAVRALFRRVGLNDWFTRDDVTWYLRKALYVATAWAARRCVGIAVLTGDGRIDVSVDLLAVDPQWQRRGIGTRLMQRVTARIERLAPYHAQVQVCERDTERFYARFGFQRNQGTWLLEHGPTADRLRHLAREARTS